MKDRSASVQEMWKVSNASASKRAEPLLGQACALRPAPGFNLDR
jgi:hypothetical protein